jgi:hypothetical protein
MYESCRWLEVQHCFPLRDWRRWRALKQALRGRTFVTSTQIENGAGGNAQTWTGKLQVDRAGGERIKSLAIITARSAI